MTKTIIGMFDDPSNAQQARTDLLALGVSDVQLEPSSDASSTGSTSLKSTRQEPNFLERFLGLGLPDDDAGLYAENIRRGGCTLRAEVDESMTDEAIQVMRRDGAVDIDRRAEYMREKGFSSYDNSAPFYNDTERSEYRNDYSTWESQRYGMDSDQKVLPVVEEDVKIGKRAVEGGGIRVYSRVTETPVEEDIKLRREEVRVERRPVDRMASEADFNSFKDGEFEVTERSEEAVVSKEARVVEEVVVSKEATEETQHISETKRRKDVDVERLNNNKRPH